MKLNYDLIRELLLLIEDKAQIGAVLNAEDISAACQTSNDNAAILYNLKFLADAGYIDLENDMLYLISDITPAGRNYLDGIRAQTIWQQVKKDLHDKSIPMTIDAIKFIAAKFIERMISS